MELLKQAAAAMKKAYAPYSGFSVGCAVVGGSGTVYTGCNVENSSYGATICAERVAIGTAIAAGEKTLKQVAIVATADKPCAPCGICRQVIAEFGAKAEIICASADLKKVEHFKLDEILPHRFDKSFLKK